MNLQLRIYLLFIVILASINSCKNYSQADIWQNERNNIINVHKQIIEIPMDEIIVSPNVKMCILDSILIVGDGRGYDKLIHLFNKNTFKHLKSTTTLGQGPKEITQLGEICPNRKEGKFYVFDSGKQRLHSFSLDSLLNDSDYNFTPKLN